MNSSMNLAQASSPDQVRIRCFRIAGLPIEITFAGARLAELFTRTFQHLVTGAFASGEAPLRIRLWDETATGIPRPVLDLRSVFTDEIQFGEGILVHSPVDQIRGQQNPRICTLLRDGRGEAVGWIHGADDLWIQEISRPLQPILFSWYGSHGVQPVHAAVVARGEDGVLIGGKGGSGKSTTSLACTVAGFRYLSDDYAALKVAGGYSQAFSLYASLSLEDTHSRQFASILDHRIEGPTPPEMKVPFVLGDVYPARMAVSCRIRAVILPRIANVRNSSIRPATQVEAMLKMAPSSVLQLPFISASDALGRMAHLLRSVPAFWLDLGTDLSTIAPCVDEVLRLAMPLSESVA